MRWLMIGAGYSAQTLARLIAGEAQAISGTTRDAAKFGALEAAGISPLQFDGSSIPQALAQEMRAQARPFGGIVGDEPRGAVQGEAGLVHRIALVFRGGDEERAGAACVLS